MTRRPVETRTVGRPSLAGGGRTARLAVPLPPELRERVNERAAAEGTRAATWVRGLIERALGRS